MHSNRKTHMHYFIYIILTLKHICTPLSNSPKTKNTYAPNTNSFVCFLAIVILSKRKATEFIKEVYTDFDHDNKLLSNLLLEPQSILLYL